MTKEEIYAILDKNYIPVNMSEDVDFGDSE